MFYVRTLSSIILCATALLSTFLPTVAADDPPLSTGCTAFNIASLYDGQYSGMTTAFLTLNADEQIMLTSDSPMVGSTPPTQIELRVNGITVTENGFPATITYIVPATGKYQLIWLNVSGIHTSWDVECTG